MTRARLRIRNTPLDNMVDNLRGEVGEIISSWVLLRYFMDQNRLISSGDINTDFHNQELTIIRILSKKLKDEIIARLSELAQQKIGRLNFYSVSVKLGKFNDYARQFTIFIERNRFSEKRNYDISHKELPEKWTDHKFIMVPYTKLIRGIALAVALMKKIDRFVLGPIAPTLWRQARKNRYNIIMPPRVTYMLLPYYLRP